MEGRKDLFLVKKKILTLDGPMGENIRNLEGIYFFSSYTLLDENFSGIGSSKVSTITEKVGLSKSE